jgi:hypothetical protein
MLVRRCTEFLAVFWNFFTVAPLSVGPDCEKIRKNSQKPRRARGKLENAEIFTLDPKPEAAAILKKI